MRDLRMKDENAYESKYVLEDLANFMMHDMEKEI